MSSPLRNLARGGTTKPITAEEPARLDVGQGENGQVIIQFSKEVLWVGLSPQQAVEVAAGLVQTAKQLGWTSS